VPKLFSRIHTYEGIERNQRLGHYTTDLTVILNEAPSFFPPTTITLSNAFVQYTSIQSSIEAFLRRLESLRIRIASPSSQSTSHLSIIIRWRVLLQSNSFLASSFQQYSAYGVSRVSSVSRGGYTQIARLFHVVVF